MTPMTLEGTLSWCLSDSEIRKADVSESSWVCFQL